MSDKIECRICGDQVHAIQLHLKDTHPDWTIERYRQEFPEAPIFSEKAKEKLMMRARERSMETAMAGSGTAIAAKIESIDSHRGFKREAMHEVFKLGNAPAARNMRGEPIPIVVLTDAGDFEDFLIDPDPNYIFPIELLKTCVMAIEMNVPLYLWGHAGTGKTTMLEQIAAYTRRPAIRVQHTANTEEAHIVGQWTVRDGRTIFELGPLAMAMKYGLFYIADEYDFAMPSVLSVYQPVLEGKALVIKEADHANRVIKPHPNFRICATGNTNGAGDETGLYQGTVMQNAANYERFGVVEEVTYMPEKQEIAVIMAQARLDEPEATKLVKFASEIRASFSAGKIGMPISPRALINAAQIGIRRGDFKVGLRQSYSNRLNRVDREVANGLAQRIFG